MRNHRALARRLLATDGLASHIREPLLMLAAYFLYLVIAKAFVSEATALANADRVIAFERALGIYRELDVQQWMLEGGKWVAVFWNGVYLFTYIPLVLLTALVLYLVARERYFYYRNLIFLSLAFFFIVFTLFPLAPPLSTEGYGFVDTVATYGPGFYRDQQSTQAYNDVAAMPSMHFGWTLVFGVMYFRSRPRWLKVIGVLYPTLTLAAVTVTGMHFLLDAIAGAIFMALVWVVYETAFRRRTVPALAAVALSAVRTARLRTFRPRLSSGLHPGRRSAERYPLSSRPSGNKI